ncbi:hypothetical protein BB560_001430 [Smittium megazygosporum]|uniref:Vps41 beta-propeller domain-containing protein n=1 Tax=Smittium megazygosporum TaxID=133381 RepID=A0A2T9ZHK4_9FUNG|nr:hypothetical protein BB560_001430 [Smittium megazygosporum]
MNKIEQNTSSSSASTNSIDEPEPFFNYKSVKGDLETIFKDDSASVALVNEKFIILGTHWGKIYVLDPLGNISRNWSSHNASVTSLALSQNGEYLVTGGDDGFVILHELFSGERRTVANQLRPVKAVAIDPFYSKTEGKIASGGLLSQLIVHESRKWPLNKRDLLVDEGKGSIRSLVWSKNVLIAANEQGVVLYNPEDFTPLTIIEHIDPSLNPDIYPIRLYLKNEDVLHICWGKYVQIVTLDESVNNTGSRTTNRQLTATISSVLENSDAVVGFSQFGPYSSLLVYPGDVDDTSGSVDESNSNNTSGSDSESTFSMELRVVNEDHEELISDLLNLPSSWKYKASDYNLVSLDKNQDLKSNTWYIISPKKILELNLKSFDEHISWLFNHGLYQRAYGSMASGIKTGSYRFGSLGQPINTQLLLQVGQTYARFLFDEKEYKESVEVLAFTLVTAAGYETGSNENQIPSLWENWAFEFASLEKLDLISDFIPVDLDGISKTIYEMILADLLNTDITKFLHTVKNWPTHIYDPNIIETIVLDKIELLSKSSNSKEKTELKFLQQALADLLDRAGMIEKAVIHYLILHYPGIIDRIERENLLPTIRGHVKLLMDYDDYTLFKSEDDYQNVSDTVSTKFDFPSRILEKSSTGDGVNLLANSSLIVPPSTVVKQLMDSPWYIHVYLHRLYAIDKFIGAQFADMQVELYAEYNPELLMNFLRNNSNYNLGKACKTCEARDLVSEMVYLLGKMGDFRKALLVILYELKDVKQAIEFAHEQHDKDLWEDLIRISNFNEEVDGLDDETNTSAEDTAASGAGLQGLDPLLIIELRLALISKADEKFISTAKLLRSMNPSTKTKGLDKAIMGKLGDFKTRVDLMISSQAVLNAYNQTLSHQRQGSLSKGISVTTSSFCKICKYPLFRAESNSSENLEKPGPSSSETVVNFWCGHSFHTKCILLPEVYEKVIKESEVSRNSLQKNLGSAWGRNTKTFENLGFIQHSSYRRFFIKTKLDLKQLISRYATIKCQFCSVVNNDTNNTYEIMDPLDNFAIEYNALSNSKVRWRIPEEYNNEGMKGSHAIGDIEQDQELPHFDTEDLPNIQELRF